MKTLRTTYQVRVEIVLKPGHSDPEGDTTAEVLKDLDYPIEKVTVSKVYQLTLCVSSAEEANRVADEISRRVLANPTKDSYSIKIEEMR